jgi:branched-subunit amino acid aminotransferase/4-amino-4-deoxychorismate lyase
VPVEVTDLDAADLEDTEEVFLTNAITGVRPVGEVIGVRSYAAPGAVTLRLIEWAARAGV